MSSPEVVIFGPGYGDKNEKPWQVKSARAGTGV